MTNPALNPPHPLTPTLTLTRPCPRPPSPSLTLCLLSLIVLLFAFTASAHIGSPTVFFEGDAGPYPVRIMIRPAQVIPGLADITVRVEAEGVEQVTALPMKWDVGRNGAPPPDVAQPVPGETNLYQSQLWFMEEGAQSVEVAISGKRGNGKIAVPVDAVATRVLGMPRGLGSLLALFGFVLAALLISIIGGAVRESVVQAGQVIAPRRRWLAFGSMAGAVVLLGFALLGGRAWWNAEAADYQQNRLRRPTQATAVITTEKGTPLLRIAIAFPQNAPPLVPDHGKLMHLFLVREPALDAFAHLHPIKRNRTTFESILPNLPSGSYDLYGDITYETGLSETLTQRVEIPPQSIPVSSVAETSTSPNADPDDAWRISEAIGKTGDAGQCRLSSGYVAQWLEPRALVAGKPVTLHFAIHDPDAEPAKLDPYLGMLGHLVIRSEDGSVFTHVHPGGTASMAALQLAAFRAEGKVPLRAAFGKEEPICRLPTSHGLQPIVAGLGDAEGVSFPYAFPKPGRYRLWLQVKIAGKIQTAVFDADVGS